jgi:hypothetical protein
VTFKTVRRSKIEVARKIPTTKILFMKTISVTLTVRWHMCSDKWMGTALSGAVDKQVYLNKKYIFVKNLHVVGTPLILNLAILIITIFWITSPYVRLEPSNRNHIFRIVHVILATCIRSYLPLYYCTNVNIKFFPICTYESFSFFENFRFWLHEIFQPQLPETTENKFQCWGIYVARKWSSTFLKKFENYSEYFSMMMMMMMMTMMMQRNFVDKMLATKLKPPGNNTYCVTYISASNSTWEAIQS